MRPAELRYNNGVRSARRLGAALAGLALAASVRAAERVPVQLVFPHPDFASIQEIRFEPAPASVLAAKLPPASAVEAAPAALSQAGESPVSKPAEPARPAQVSLQGMASAESRSENLEPYYTGEKQLRESGAVPFVIDPVRASDIAPKARFSVVRLRHPDDAPAPSKAKRPGSIATRLLRSAAAGVAVAALAPLLWSATTAVEALLLFAVAIAPVAAAAALLIAARAARAARRRVSGSARADASPPRRTIAIRALGASVGVALTAAAALGQRPAMESAHAYIDSRRPAQEKIFRTRLPGAFFASETARALAATPEGRAALARVSGRDGTPRMPAFFLAQPRQPVKALPGTFFADATVVLLSRNPVGRGVLDGLRDRGGVVRMPAFFVSHQEDSAAFYTPVDAVYLSVQSIEKGGVTVAEFLRDPAAQAAYLEREQATIVHELAHAAQMRRPLSNADVRIFLRTNASRLASAVKAYASARMGAASAATRSVPVVKAAPGKASPLATAETAAAPVDLDAAEIARSGIAVPRFLKDEQAQKRYILGHRNELARAIRPQAIAAPAAPAAPAAAARPSFHADLGMIQEWEYEAHLVEHLYTHERLKSDPTADVASGDYANYVDGLAGFDDFLRVIDGYKVYAFNFHGSSPRDARYMAGMRARWDSHRVEANVLLARRALAQSRPLAARGFLEKARLIASEKGLPAPDLLVGPLSSTK